MSDRGKSKWVEGRVVANRHWTDQLYSLSVEAPVEPFQAGQFGRLALELDGEMVARPYSYVNAPHERPLEFYSIIVPEGPLSSRLARLEPGAALFLIPRAAGFLILSEVQDAPQLWLLSTGTALGPFLSILKTQAPWQRFPRVVLVHAVRTARELTYRDMIRSFQEQHPEQFAYVPFVSREDTDFAIRGRIPEAITDGRLEARTGLKIAAADSQVMICGNPDMVRDTQAVLEARGLKKNRRRDPGHISVENYW